MCCTQLGFHRTQKWRKKSPSAHHCTTLSGWIFATKARIDKQRKLVKQHYLLHMLPQYGELRPTSGWEWFRSLGHPRKIQRVLRLGFVTAAMSFIGGQPNFARCLAVSWAATLYIIFGGTCPLTEFRHVKIHFASPPSLVFSYIGSITAWHSSTGVSQTLRRGTRNGITELSQRVMPIFGCVAITLGIGPHSSL